MKPIIGTEGFSASDFVPLREAFAEVYKASTGEDLDISGCEYDIAVAERKVGDFTVRSDPTVTWYRNGKPADRKVAKRLSETLTLLEWLLAEAYPLYAIKTGSSGPDRYVKHPHKDREAFIRANLYAAFRALSGDAMAQAVEIKGNRAEISKVRGLYIPQPVLTRLVAELHGEAPRCDVIEPILAENERLLRLKEVLKIVPVSRSSWLKGVKDGKYPKPVRLAERTVAWREADILALIDRAKNGKL